MQATDTFALSFPGSSFKIRAFIAPNGVAWFQAKSVCDLLGLSNPTRVVRDYCDAQDVQMVSYGRGRPQTFLLESAVYDLAFESKTVGAKVFKRWISREVLPAIRAEGGFLSTGASRAQLSAIGHHIQRILDTPDPYAPMWDRETIAAISKFYGRQSSELFWWRWIYAFLTPEERCKLNSLNPIDPGTHRRKEIIHRFLEQEAKEPLRDWVRTVREQILSASSKSDFETGLLRLSGVNQLELLP